MSAAARPSPRLLAPDLVRGVAVMGILLMNIQSFALPEAAYLNPAAAGGARGADLAVWAVELVLVDGKMRGLFSWLFGASILLATQSAGERAAAVHYRRMAALFAFGLAHDVLVWDGDILMHYALIGSLAFLWRGRQVHELVAAAAALILVQSVVAFTIPFAASQLAVMPHPDPEAARSLADLHDQFAGSLANTAREVALHRGGWSGLVAYRWHELPGLIGGTLYEIGGETLGYMLLGMAALKGGLFAGEWPFERLRQGAAWGLGAGAIGFTLLAAWVVADDFDFRAVTWEALVWSAPFRLAMIPGWACLILLAARPGGWLTRRVAAVGRVAFSNYLGTSLVCAGLFDGLGWFGRLSRAELLPFVPAVWCVMLAWSAPWLARFRYGPMEWAWRSLARGRVQPMRR